MEIYRKINTLYFKRKVFKKFIEMIPDGNDKGYYLSVIKNNSLHKYFYLIHKIKATAFINDRYFGVPNNYSSLKESIKNINEYVILTDEEKELREQCLEKMKEDNELQDLRIKIIDLLITAYDDMLTVFIFKYCGASIKL